MSGQQQVKAVQSDQTCNYQMARFWAPYFGMHKVFYFSITVTKKKPINSEYYIALFLHLKEEIITKRPQMMKKKVLFHQNNAVCHKSIATMAKLHELHLELLLQLIYIMKTLGLILIKDLLRIFFFPQAWPDDPPLLR